MNNFEYERGLRSQVVEILNQNVMHMVRIEEATEEQDTRQATDFVIRITGGTVAARVRRGKNTPWRDLTIRSRSRHGGKTEIHKLSEGWGDYYIYCWERDGQIVEYMLLDINKMNADGWFGDFGLWDGERDNHDGTFFWCVSAGKLRERRYIIRDNIGVGGVGRLTIAQNHAKIR